jgi:hypothetical protein
MYNQLPEVHINYKNGPCFLNFEKRLPVDDSPGRYIEAYYCGGGSRLVYDNATGTSFVSAHYSSFHVLSNGSSPVLHNSQSFLLEATALYQALQSAKWTAMERLFPASVKLLTGKTRPAPPAAGEKDPPSQTT